MLYDYKCDKCGHVWEESRSLATREAPLQDPCPKCLTHGQIRQVISAPNHSGQIQDPYRLGRKKPPAGFSEVLRNIGKVSPGHNMNIRD